MNETIEIKAGKFGGTVVLSADRRSGSVGLSVNGRAVGTANIALRYAGWRIEMPEGVDLPQLDLGTIANDDAYARLEAAIAKALR